MLFNSTLLLDEFTNVLFGSHYVECLCLKSKLLNARKGRKICGNTQQCVHIWRESHKDIEWFLSWRNLLLLTMQKFCFYLMCRQESKQKPEYQIQGRSKCLWAWKVRWMKGSRRLFQHKLRHCQSPEKEHENIMRSLYSQIHTQLLPVYGGLSLSCNLFGLKCSVRGFILNLFSWLGELRGASQPGQEFRCEIWYFHSALSQCSFLLLNLAWQVNQSIST